MENEEGSREEEIYSMIQEVCPEKTLVQISEYEDGEHQTYKHLYESLQNDYDALQRDFFTEKNDLDTAQQEIISLKDELDGQKQINTKLTGSASSITEFIQKYLTDDVMVCNARAYNADGSETGTQGNTDTLRADENSIAVRPAWMQELGKEMCRDSIAEKTASRTKGELARRLLGLKGKKGKDEGAELAKKRQEQVVDLLNRHDMTNQEKYIRYLLLSPSLPRDYLKTLTGAEELGIDADVVIKLLEQPPEFFNKELVETYVSECRKAASHDLKQELAEELIYGEWYIMADDGHGERKKFQLVPYDEILGIQEKLSQIYDSFLEIQTGGIPCEGHWNGDGPPGPEDKLYDGEPIAVPEEMFDDDDDEDDDPFDEDE